MNVPLRNWLLLNKTLKKKYCVFIIVYSAFSNVGTSQISNFVNNGSFEDLYSCSYPNLINKAKYWRSIDSITAPPQLQSACVGINTVPFNSYTYQNARTGITYITSTFFCPPPSCAPIQNRLYLRNRLKANLKAGRTYCVSFYVNICGNSTYGIDGFGAYFADNSIDTITKCGIPLTYLSPQVQNATNNIITDTLGWTKVEGIFTATGNEKHLIIGNFKSDAATNSTLINTSVPYVATDVCIDDVSCIDVDLPAYAGNDTMCIPGTSVYIGRARDVGIDEACIWYQLPNMSSVIAKAAGLWVSPVVTSTYVVRQEICGIVKWDTVVVHQTAVGLDEFNNLREDFTLYPVPVENAVTMNFNYWQYKKRNVRVVILNELGKFMKEEEVLMINDSAKITTDDLANGIYFLQVRGISGRMLVKRFIVCR